MDAPECSRWLDKPIARGVERLRAWCEGFSLHAGVVIADHDREALERLCRYGTRPAFAHDRLAWTADGQTMLPSDALAAPPSPVP